MKKQFIFASLILPFLIMTIPVHGEDRPTRKYRYPNGDIDWNSSWRVTAQDGEIRVYTFHKGGKFTYFNELTKWHRGGVFHSDCRWRQLGSVLAYDKGDHWYSCVAKVKFKEGTMEGYCVNNKAERGKTFKGERLKK